jgi:hypothetical protein
MHDTQHLESWLAAEVFDTPAADAPSSFLSHLDPFQRTRLLYDLLDQRPALAAATRRLSLSNQLRLSVELVGGTRSTVGSLVQRHAHASPVPVRCFANAPGAHRPPRRS